MPASNRFGNTATPTKLSWQCVITEIRESRMVDRLSLRGGVGEGRSGGRGGERGEIGGGA